MVYFVKRIREVNGRTTSICMTSSKTYDRADRHDRPLLNPCWVLFKQPFLSINEDTCFLMILSSTLLNTEVSEIGGRDLGLSCHLT